MKLFTVIGGVATVGAGELIHLTADQIKSREHNIDLVEKTERGGIVRAKVPLQFIVGEEIGLTELPPRLVDILAPVDPPETEAERQAAARREKAEADKRAAAHRAEQAKSTKKRR